MSTTDGKDHPKIGPRQGKAHEDLVEVLSKKVVGQQAAMKYIVPYVYMYQAGLAPEGRPAGVFLLLGPTGTGKTRSVEAIGEVLHGSARKMLKVDCGEFQMDHEVAKLIGSPPGYLGHRETVPMLTQAHLETITSEQCDLALVLFDEIEKAAPSMTRLLLGILDKGTLRLGDNTMVDFERTLIFFTSNLGAKEMMKEINPDIGFQRAIPKDRSDLTNRLESIALAAVRKRFSPEFINRLDAVVTYQPLNTESLSAILDQHLDELQRHVNTRLGTRCFTLDVGADSREYLLRKGTSDEYGARELKRTLHRQVTQPLAALVATGKIEPGARVKVDLSDDGESLIIRASETHTPEPAVPQTILIVDDNRDLLRFLERLMGSEGWNVLTAASARQARDVFAKQRPGTVLLDFMLGDDDGVRVGLDIQRLAPRTQVILMTGGEMSTEEQTICWERKIPILRKPFLGNDVLELVRQPPFRIAKSDRQKA
ncbi:MAG TPA: AAA family ATPase [Blastocatellia bacterium]|nr:AAA family ATPase [Blastocatellia bacterium]